MSKKKLQFENVAPFYVVSILLLITVIAVLAYFALEPYEQSARQRDKERRSGVSRLSSALMIYFETNSEYPTVAEMSWEKVLLKSKSLGFVPARVEYKTKSFCASNTVSGTWCYVHDGEHVIVYSSLESKAERARCNNSDFDVPFFLWSSEMEANGIVCTDGIDPSIGSIKFVY